MRASWKVNYCNGEHGPYIIQLAISDGRGGCRYSPSLPEHQRFKTWKQADAVRRSLPSPIIRHGIVIDGIRTTGIVTGVAY